VLFTTVFRGGARLPAVVCSSLCYSNDVIAFEPQGCAVAVTTVTVDLALTDDPPISRRALHLIQFLAFKSLEVPPGVPLDAGTQQNDFCGQFRPGVGRILRAA
jgi:hypothetical protein